MQYTILENQMIAKETYRMCLKGDTTWIEAPGQFLNLQIEGCYLRRPISVSTWNETQLTIVYKVVGKGTKLLSKRQLGTTLDALTGLGNGFSLDIPASQVVLIGGGVGVPPLLGLCEALRKQQKQVRVLLGFQSQKEVFYEAEFAKLGCQVDVCTDDGSYGHAGRVTQLLEKLALSGWYYAACGPKAMLQAIVECSTAKGQISLEERMGCGYGACLACTCKTKDGYARVCKEGPVFHSEDIIWND